MITTKYRITARRFVKEIQIGESGKVVLTAVGLCYLRRKKLDWVIGECQRRGWKFEEIGKIETPCKG